MATDCSGFYDKGVWCPYLNCDECLRLRRIAMFDMKNWPRFEKHVWAVHAPQPVKKYAFTFTTPETTLEEQQIMCDSAYRLFVQNTTPIRQGEVFLEYTERGAPHLHGWYETIDGGRVFAKTFRRCWHRWGEKARMTKFAGGYHELMKSERFLGYASSEGRCLIRKTEQDFLFDEAVRNSYDYV